MLQIIGWLMCVYLVIKGFELVAMKNTYAYIGAVVAFIAAPVFFLLINEQIRATSQPLEQFGMTNPYSPTGVDDDALAAAQKELDDAQKDMETLGR